MIPCVHMRLHGHHGKKLQKPVTFEGVGWSINPWPNRTKLWQVCQMKCCNLPQCCPCSHLSSDPMQWIKPSFVEFYSRAGEECPAGKGLPHTISRAFILTLSFQTGGFWPQSGQRAGQRMGTLSCLWICPNCLGKALGAVIWLLPGEVQKQQKACFNTRELRLMFDFCFCFPSCEAVEEMSSLSQLTFAFELMFAKYWELPGWWGCKPHSLTLLSLIGKSHAGLGI